MVKIEPPPRGLHERLGQPRGADERIGGDVEREPEAVARRVREAAFEVARVGEGDGVDEEIELTAEGLPDLREHALEPFVGADVALRHERARDRLRQLADTLLDPLALVGEGEARTSASELLRDGPCDRAAIGHAEDEPSLSREISQGASSLFKRPSRNEGLSRRAT